MNRSTPSSQYFIKPPDVPMFLAGRASNLRNLILWAKQEHQRGLMYASEKGLYKTLRHLNKEYSPIRVLAQMKSFRRICAGIKREDWDALTGRERVLSGVRLKMRELLLREN